MTLSFFFVIVRASVLVDRGGCTFFKKIAELERAGAAAVLVANVLDADNIFMMVRLDSIQSSVTMPVSSLML